MYKRKPCYKKPVRLCIFCDKMQNNGTLSRHIRKCHKHHPRVNTALEMNRKKSLMEFKSFKNEGIYKYNTGQASLECPEYQREKKANVWKNLKCCGSCKAFIGTRGFNRHEKKCQENHCKKVVSLPMSLFECNKRMKLDEDFKSNILAKFRNNPTGTLCRKDEAIISIGSVFYRKIKIKLVKAIQVRRSVRMEMRRLGNLYLTFLRQENIVSTYGNAQDMFLRRNFNQMKNAIEDYSTTPEGKIKPGLKQNLLYLLKRSAKALKAILMADEKDNESNEIERFMQVLELWEDYIFGDAQYELNKRRQTNLRRPDKLPNEDDVQLVRNYLIEKMKILTEDPF